MAPLRIERRDTDGWAVLRVTGTVDVETAPQLHQAVTEAQHSGGRYLALELDGVEFVDAFGLGVIVGALKWAGTHDGEVALVCSRSRLLHLFEVTRLDRILPIAPSLAAHGPAPDPGHR